MIMSLQLKSRKWFNIEVKKLGSFSFSAYIFVKVSCFPLVIQSHITKWVVPEKIHTSPTDGILEILVEGGGGGVKDSGNPGGRGSWT